MSPLRFVGNRSYGQSKVTMEKHLTSPLPRMGHLYGLMTTATSIHWAQRPHDPIPMAAAKRVSPNPSRPRGDIIHLDPQSLQGLLASLLYSAFFWDHFR